MRTRRARLLVAGVGIAIAVGIGFNTGRRNDHGGGPTASTTIASGAAAEFVRMNDARGRALDAWDQAQGNPYATFLPVSTQVLGEEERIRDQAAARTCETADEDPCRLLDLLRRLADQEWTRLGALERAKRLGRRAEAYAAFTGLRAANCDYAGTVVELLDRPSSPIRLADRLPALRNQAYGIALTACDTTLDSDRALLRAARAEGVRPASWPPSTLRFDPPDQEWRIYARAVDRSAVIVKKVLGDLQRSLHAVVEGYMPPEAFADQAGPDPAAAQAQLDPDASASSKQDWTLIGRLAEAQRVVAELGPPTDPDVRRAWQAYRGALRSYELAVKRAATGDLRDMKAALAKGNSRAAPALAAFASHRR
jgi:hypothetical protein